MLICSLNGGFCSFYATIDMKFVDLERKFVKLSHLYYCSYIISYY
jgi:hypothetical protein